MNYNLLNNIRKSEFPDKTCSLLLLIQILVLVIAGCNQEKRDTSKKEGNSTQSEKPVHAQFADHVTLEEFPSWIKGYLDSLEWKNDERNNKLTRKILDESLNLGRQFMINNQKPDGNFNYQYDFVEREIDEDDNQVRQAGALWGLSLMYQYDQDPRNKAALDKALEFFFKHTQKGPVEGSLHISYPGDSICQTGTVALVALGIIEYLRTENSGLVKLTDEYRGDLIRKLNGYIEFLQFMRLENKHFSRSYSLIAKIKSPSFSPYFDGEIMLCMIKAAKYLGYNNLIPLIEDSAMVMANYYTIHQWRFDPDSKLTKGFFQWSCMAFWEYQDAGWKNAETFGDYVLAIAWWMIHTHRTLERTRNTAYAYEGIIHAYLLAKTLNHQAVLNDLANTIDIGLYKLTKWQVGGPYTAPH